MDNHQPSTDNDRAAEPLADKAARINREQAAIAAAHAAIDAGLGIEDATLEAWLDALDKNEFAPLPTSSAAATPR